MNHKKQPLKKLTTPTSRRAQLPMACYGLALVLWVVLGVFQGGVAYVCLCIGLKTTPPVTASLVSGIEPVLNPILVALFYGEQIGGFAMVGAAVVIVGVVGYNVLKGRQSREPARP